MADNANRLLTPDELDTIGEIMNISMGSAATAVSTMLEKQVTITTPRIEQEHFKNIDSSNLEPALIVKIRYTQGIDGTNVIMLRRHDIQIILDLLMGNDLTSDTDDFEFDDMSMSAACEVMNQMMGASATALSEILEMPINISTPEAILVETKDELQSNFFSIGDEEVVAISFKMMIKDVLDTTFTCFLTTELASRIVGIVTNTTDVPEPEPVPQQPAMAAAPAAPVAQQPTPQPTAYVPPVFDVPAEAPVYTQQPAAAPAIPQQPVQQQAAPAVPQQQAAPAAQQPMYQQPPEVDPNQARQPMQFGIQSPAQEQQAQMPYGYGQYPPQYGQQPYMPYGQMPFPYPYPQNPQTQAYAAPPVSVKNAEFPDFSKQSTRAPMPSGSNMGLLMGVQLDVSVIIGRTKRKIKDVMEFGQGTVVELDKQTGAPAEIMVNGQLLAYGDVIVVGDNFGVRITEIVGTKELLDSLDPRQK